MNTLQTYLRDLSEWVQQDRHLFFLGFPLMIKDLGNKFIILFKQIHLMLTAIDNQIDIGICL